MNKILIPRGNGEFYIWQANFVNRSVTNQVAWGFPAAAVAALVARRAQYEPLYLAIQNENTRTRNGVQTHNEMRAIYEKELRAFVRNYCGPLSNSDKRDLGLTIRDLEPTPRPAIITVPVVEFDVLRGGILGVAVKVARDKTMASIHPDADGVEVQYDLIPVGEMPPEKPTKSMETQVSKKARFKIATGIENAGKKFYGFFRWTNLTTPANNGPWSDPQPVVIA